MGTHCAIANMRRECSSLRQRRFPQSQRNFANRVGYVVDLVRFVRMLLSFYLKSLQTHTYRGIKLFSLTPRFKHYQIVIVVRKQGKQLPLSRHCRPLMPIRHIRRSREIIVVNCEGVVRVIGAVTSASDADVGTVNLGPVRDHVLVNHATEEGVTTSKPYSVSYNSSPCVSPSN